MFRLQVKGHFDSGHYLRGYRGKCAQPHGHRWEYEVVVQGDKLDELGMLVDFSAIKAIMKKVEDILDHRMLNDVPPFDVVNPTAENLAQFIYDFMDKHHLDPARVTVWESPECCVKYYKGRGNEDK